VAVLWREIEAEQLQATTPSFASTDADRGGQQQENGDKGKDITAASAYAVMLLVASQASGYQNLILRGLRRRHDSQEGREGEP
jgi:hypothetical protein